MSINPPLVLSYLLRLLHTRQGWPRCTMLRFTSLGLRTLPRAPPLSRATLAVTLPRGFHNQPTSRTEQPVLESGTHTVDSAIHAGKMPGLWADIFAKREELRFKWWLVGAVAVAGGFMRASLSSSSPPDSRKTGD